MINALRRALRALLATPCLVSFAVPWVEAVDGAFCLARV